MKAQELMNQTPEQLREQLVALKKEAFNLRFQHVTGKLDNYARIGQIRKDVARYNTLLRAREIEEAEKL